MAHSVNYQRQEQVGVIRIDDGKANALSPELIEFINAAIDQAEADDVDAIALIGREGKFCAGFDLSVMGAGRDQAFALLNAGGLLALRLFEMPKSVVIGATGHAMAMGALLLLSADERIGADGPYKIGLNEVQIGMALPAMGVQLAKERLQNKYLTRAVINSELFTPQEAVDVGYLDRIVEPEKVATVAIAMATHLAENLDAVSRAETKVRMRADRAAAIRRVLSEGKGI
ncbi:MAG: crotonase/enoyl-CoA hydratase family protein [Pseudomonadota bacterium]